MTYFEFLDSTEKEKKLNKWEFDYHEGVTIEFQNVWFKYPNTDSYIFENLNFKINKNEKIAIVGTNGAGKTTIVKLICGLFEPNKGQVLVNNVDLKTIDKEDYQKLISTVFQDYDIYALTVLENVKVAYHNNMSYGLFSSIFRTKKYWKEENEVHQKAQEILEVLGLLEYKDELAQNLPYGKQRKLEIARALATFPRLLCLDEPAAGMNPHETEELMKTIKIIQENFINRT